MGRIVVLTDRSPSLALPAVQHLGSDVKAEPLSPQSAHHVAELAPAVVVVDGAERPEEAFEVLAILAAIPAAGPVVVILSSGDLDRFPWHEVADELVSSSVSPAELRVRLAMLARRTGGGGESVLRLGPLSIDPETYRVIAGGRVLDLAYKEFELLRFLVQRPGRVCTRDTLLQEVWGYNFYGGTRTVDVHIRRLRAKLGPEHEWLIETVRGVGYRAADSGRPAGYPLGEGEGPVG